MNHQESVIEITLEDDRKEYFKLSECPSLIAETQFAKGVRILDALPENACYSEPKKLRAQVR